MTTLTPTPVTLPASRPSLRRRLRSLPLLGPLAYKAYLLARGEGRILTIPAGPLKGLKLRQSREITAVLPDLTSGDYERDTLERFARELRPGQTVYDVGAHSGLYAMFAARLVGPAGRVLAVEAHPGNAAHVRDAFALNQLTNCAVAAVAVSDRVGRSHLFDNGNSTMFRLAEAAGPAPSSATDDAGAVDTTTLVHLAQTHGDPDVIKMDIEGAEDLALRAAEPLLRRKRPTLLVEIHTPALAASLHPYLRSLGYRLLQLDDTEIPDSTWHRFIVAK